MWCINEQLLKLGTLGTDQYKVMNVQQHAYSGTSLKGLSVLRTQYKKNLPIKDKFYSPIGTMLIHFYL